LRFTGPSSRADCAGVSMRNAPKALHAATAMRFSGVPT
jgi:hypothetical protein